MINTMKPLFLSLAKFSKERMGFNEPPRLFLRSCEDNSKDMLGKTAYYDPNKKSITIFTHNRHPKDILRSFAHELVHHCQNLRGDLLGIGNLGKNYAQDNMHMRNMEKEAYLQGNMCFRDWEDSLDNKTQFKITIAERQFLKENKDMSVKISKKDLKNLVTKLIEAKLQEKNNLSDPEVQKLLQTAQDASAEVRAVAKSDDKNKKAMASTPKPATTTVKEEDNAFGASHYCIHHGGVNHNGGIAMAEAIQHVAPDANGFISHYDMKLADGTILEYVAAEDIQVTNASLAEEHKRDDKHKAYKRDYLEETEELEEGGCGKSYKRDVEAMKENEELEEGEDIGKRSVKYDADDNPEETKMDHLPAAALKKAAEKRRKQNESKIQTPEQEQKLYESRFNKRNDEIFNKLKNLWTK